MPRTNSGTRQLQQSLGSVPFKSSSFLAERSLGVHSLIDMEARQVLTSFSRKGFNHHEHLLIMSLQVVWPPALIYVFSVMMTSICKEFWQFLLAQGILGGLCMGGSMGPAMAAVGQYFHKNRGAAMGLSVAGSSLGGVIFPIALSKMLYNPSLGFGWTVRILGFIMLALILPACFTVRGMLILDAQSFKVGSNESILFRISQTI